MGTIHDYLDPLVNYSTYVICFLVILLIDYFMPKDEIMQLGQWRHISKPNYTEDSANFYKVLGVYWAFGCYMLVNINRFQPTYVKA